MIDVFKRSFAVGLLAFFCFWGTSGIAQEGPPDIGAITKKGYTDIPQVACTLT